MNPRLLTPNSTILSKGYIFVLRTFTFTSASACIIEDSGHLMKYIISSPRLSVIRGAFAQWPALKNYVLPGPCPFHASAARLVQVCTAWHDGPIRLCTASHGQHCAPGTLAGAGHAMESRAESLGRREVSK